jgi:hypothetical protein
MAAKLTPDVTISKMVMMMDDEPVDRVFTCYD